MKHLQSIEIKDRDGDIAIINKLTPELAKNKINTIRIIKDESPLEADKEQEYLYSWFLQCFFNNAYSQSDSIKILKTILT